MNKMMMICAMIALMGCGPETLELYQGSSREIWGDNQFVVHQSDVIVALDRSHDLARLEIDGCSVLLREVSQGDAGARRYQLYTDNQYCESGFVYQVLAGDPVQVDLVSGEEIEVAMWWTRNDGQPSLIYFRGERL